MMHDCKAFKKVDSFTTQLLQSSKLSHLDNEYITQFHHPHHH